MSDDIYVGGDELRVSATRPAGNLPPIRLEPVPGFLGRRPRQHLLDAMRRLENCCRGSEGVRIDVTRENATEIAHVLERLANLAKR